MVAQEKLYPEEDIDGSRVREVYYREQDLERIVQYCERDVVTVARIFLRLRGEGELPDASVVRLPQDGFTDGN